MKLIILRGNDVTIAYTPRKCDGIPFENARLYLKSYRGTQELKYTQENERYLFSIPAEMQNLVEYSLEAIFNDGSIRDKKTNFISFTDDERKANFTCPDTGIDVHVIEVTSEIDGFVGRNGYTPYVAENGNWWINGTDTGHKAQGEALHYADLNPTQIKELQKPAIDAGTTAKTQGGVAEKQGKEAALAANSANEAASRANAAAATIADKVSKDELYQEAETNPTEPPSIPGQVYYNTKENRLFISKKI